MQALLHQPEAPEARTPTQEAAHPGESSDPPPDRPQTRGSMAGDDQAWVGSILSDLNRNLCLSPRTGSRTGSAEATLYFSEAEPACGLRRDEFLNTADLRQVEAARRNRDAIPALNMGGVHPGDSDDDERMPPGSACPAGGHEATRHEAVPPLHLGGMVATDEEYPEYPEYPEDYLLHGHQEDQEYPLYVHHEDPHRVSKSSAARSSVLLPAISKVTPEDVAEWTAKFLSQDPRGPEPPKQRLAYGKPGHAPFGELQTSTMRREEPGAVHLPCWAMPKKTRPGGQGGSRRGSPPRGGAAASRGVKLPPVAERLRETTSKLLRQAAKERGSSLSVHAASDAGLEATFDAPGAFGAPGDAGLGPPGAQLTQHFHCHFHVLSEPPSEVAGSPYHTAQDWGN